MYRVRDGVRQTDLALKLVTPTEAAWLRREFDTLRQIRHENLVQVFDWGTLDSGDAYYTMEYLEGGDWSRSTGKPQPPDVVRRLLTSILRGLAHLHCHGELHGDLKPANVLLGAGAIVKVSDVGMGGSDSTIRTASGTPGFAAPELWEKGQLSIQGDIYSVGVMAYEAVTGRHPFEGKTVRDVISGQLVGWVPSPGVHGANLPADLERAIMRALERSPDLRYTSADEFLDELAESDPVGQILGGRFVGRTAELATLEGILLGESRRPPTSAFVCGPAGVGKTALIDELAHRCLSNGMRVLDAPGSDPTLGLVEQLRLEGRIGAEISLEAPVSSIAEGLWEMGTQGPVLVRVEPVGSADSLSPMLQLSRFLSALAAERGVASHVLFIVETREAPVISDDETTLLMEPLDPEGVGDFTQGFLGKARLEPEQRDRLHRSTGGLPNSLLDLLSDLIARRILVRRNGEWSLQDIGELRDLGHSGIPARLQTAWDHLDGTLRRVLTAIALFEKGLNPAALEELEPGATMLTQLLSSRGWSLTKNNRTVTTSKGIRASVLALASASEREELERRILSSAEASIDPADRAETLLRYPDIPEALQLGLASVEESFALRDFARAAGKGRACLGIALKRSDRPAAMRALILVADSLHRLGRYDEASDLLADNNPLLNGDEDEFHSAQRERLLGNIHREQGDLAKARRHLSRSVELAEATGNISLSLWSQADLADIDWRYGDDTIRVNAMARVRDVISKMSESADLRNERAALTYQLGSALILSGRREEASAVLQSALAYEPGDYWRMRIANAIGAAEYYLGHFDPALKWSNEARRFAESSGSDSYKARIHSNRAGLYYGMGRFRDAVEHHGLSAMWAKRTGSMFEYQAACSGASINLTMTGQYEEAIVQARESERAARHTGDMAEVAKSHELEALANFHIGDYGEAQKFVALGLSQAEHSDAECTPRLHWLAGRLACVRADWATAENHLRRALSILELSKDWEDLPGVKIELQLLAYWKKDSAFDLAALFEAAVSAEERGAVLVFLRGALAVGQVLLELSVDHSKGRDLLGRALSQAEVSDAAELAWQLSYLIGELDTRSKDIRSASSRQGHALRGLRQIADRLSQSHRALYLSTPHARALLSRVG